MTVFWRYWLLQVPGWIILGALLVAARHYIELPFGWALTVFGLWLLKDVAFYPILARHYQTREDGPHRALVGAHGVAREPLEPSGYVSLRGELWRAELADGEAVGPGEEVVVESVEGLTLRVRRPSPSAPSP